MVLACDERGTAPLLEYGRLRLLLPGGFPAEKLTARFAAHLEGSPVVALGESDAREGWEAIRPALILPPAGADTGGGWIELTTDRVKL